MGRKADWKRSRRSESPQGARGRREDRHGQSGCSARRWSRAFSRATSRADPGNVGGVKICTGKMCSERNDDGSRAGADVGDLQSTLIVEARSPQQHGFDKMLGFGAWDQNGGRDAEVEAVELLVSGDVLYTAGAAADHAAQFGSLLCRQLIFAVCREECAIAVESVHQQQLGVALVDEGGGSVRASRTVMRWSASCYCEAENVAQYRFLGKRGHQGKRSRYTPSETCAYASIDETFHYVTWRTDISLVSGMGIQHFSMAGRWKFVAGD